MKEKKDAAALEAFFSLAFLLFLSLSFSITYAFPFTYKRGSETSHEGHTAERAQQDSIAFNLFTRELGPSLSLTHL